MGTVITREDLSQIKGMSPKLLRALESLFVDTASALTTAQGAVQSTGSIQNATVLVLSSNAAFANERVLALDPAFFSQDDDGPGNALNVTLINIVRLNGGYRCTFNLRADTNLDLPNAGRVPSSSDGPFADDAGAAATGINVGEWYAKTDGTVHWRQA